MAGSAVIASAMRICFRLECSRPPDGHAPLVGGGEAGTGALTDHVALELGECGKASRDFGSLLTAFTLDELASFERATVTRPLAADFSNSS